MTNFARLSWILALSCALLACTESSRETASGRGNIRGVNAIVDVLDTNFLIEERSLGVLTYKSASPARRFDDLHYLFNFDIAITGQLNSQRIASIPREIVADHDFVFVAAGYVASPDTFVWEEPEREWTDTETVFEMAFAHLDITTGPLDVYFAPPGTDPVLGNQQGTIAYGDKTDVREFETGEYQLILTTPNSPLDVQYSGIPFTNPAGQTSTYMILTADPTITGSISVRQLLPAGDTFEVPDERFPPTIQLITASLETGNVDLVIDNDFVNPPTISDQPFGIVSADVDVPAGTTPFTYTAPGDTTALLEEDTSIATGRRTTIILLGDLSTLATTILTSQRRTLATEARIRFANAAFNNSPLDVYFSPEGSVLGDIFPLTRQELGAATDYIQIAAGSYELTLTAAADKDIILLGPVLIDLENGDIEEMVFLDNVDPAIVDLLIYSNIP
jgi:hypothetical protein